MKFYIIAKLRQCMTKADVERLMANNEAERAAKGPFEFLKVAVAKPNLGN